jgi:hypothetical protein
MSTPGEYPEIELTDEELSQIAGAAHPHFGHLGLGLGFGGLGFPLGYGFGVSPVVEPVVSVPVASEAVVEQPVTTVQTTTTYQLV